MALLTITLPPGVYKNGTMYDAKGRYYDGNLVRWHHNVLRPMGGNVKKRKADGDQWQSIATETSIARDAMQWRDNTNKTWSVFGRNDAVKVYDGNGDHTIITPTGFTGTASTVAANTGYGTTFYGLAAYGEPRPFNEAVGKLGIYRWQFSTWGEDLIAAANNRFFRGGIYSYSPTDSALVAVSNAPTDVNGAIVTDERIVMCIGSDTDARLVRWSDRENRTQWTPSDTNYSGSISLPGNGALIAITSINGQILIIGEQDVYVGRFLGAPYVYGFDKIATNVGIEEASSLVIGGNAAYWYANEEFWRFDGEISKLDCEVSDFLSSDISKINRSKMSTFFNTKFQEVWWLYQSNTDTEVRKYVCYDVSQQIWTTGVIDRTCGVYNMADDTIIMSNSASGSAWSHEISNALPDECYIETGPLELGQGETNMAVRDVYPDAVPSSGLIYYLITSQGPEMAEVSHGPYTMRREKFSTRAMGRQIRMRIEFQDDTGEIGSKTRFEVAKSGTGRR